VLPDVKRVAQRYERRVGSPAKLKVTMEVANGPNGFKGLIGIDRAQLEGNEDSWTSSVK